MRILLIYDIVNDRHRVKIVDACMDYGLDRIQYSAFTGLLGRNHQEELMLRIKAILGDGEGRIHLIPLTKKLGESVCLLNRAWIIGKRMRMSDHNLPMNEDDFLEIQPETGEKFVTISLLKQYIYCPRVVYYETCTPG